MVQLTSDAGNHRTTSFPSGVWPVMLTPFTADGQVDYESLGRLVDWYEKQGCAGLFAVCQSSEMFYLSLEERVEISRFVKKRASIPVISSGHISEKLTDQIDELQRVADTGIDALILISNRLAAEEESDTVFLDKLHTIMEALPPELPLGFYECPYPYKRLLSPEVTRFLAQSGRFHFIKDTSCDVENMREKLKIAQGSLLQLYNANTATLLQSLRDGASGYSGVMANFHPELYVWLTKEFARQPEKAEAVQCILTMCSLIENRRYPTNAKYRQQQEGVFSTLFTRRTGESCLPKLEQLEVEQLVELSEYIRHAVIG